MRGCDHEDDPLLFIYLIEESPSPYSIPPRVRVEILELPDMRPEMRMLLKLVIDNFPQLFDDFAVSRSGNPMQILLELLCFKDSVFTQQNALSGPEPAGSLS